MGVGALRCGMLEEMPAGGRLHSELPVMLAAPEIEHTLPPRGFTPSISHCELLQKTISSLGLFLRKVETDTTRVTTQCFLSLSVKGECHSFILNPCFSFEPWDLAHRTGYLIPQPSFPLAIESTEDPSKNQALSS